MVRPLQANPKRESEAASWHRIVFMAHGSRCHFCGAHATDAAHIVPRSSLGKAQRYAVPAYNGRPVCRKCHDQLHNGALTFSHLVVWEAKQAVNAISKAKI